MTIKTTVQQTWNGNTIKVMGKKVVGKTAYEIGLIVEGQAKLLAPKDLGYLAASITTQAFGGIGTNPEDPHKYSSRVKVSIAKGTVEYGKGQKDYSPWEMTIQSPKDPNEVLVGTPLSYGPYQEFGTVRTPAQPFLRPALDLAKGKVLTICKKFGKMIFKDYLHA